MKNFFLSTMVLTLLVACNANAHDEIIGYWKHHEFTRDTFTIEITKNSYTWGNTTIENPKFSKENDIWTIKTHELGGHIIKDGLKPIDSNTIELFEIFDDKPKSKGKYIRITKETYDDIMKNHKFF